MTPACNLCQFSKQNGWDLRCTRYQDGTPAAATGGLLATVTRSQSENAAYDKRGRTYAAKCTLYKLEQSLEIITRITEGN